MKEIDHTSTYYALVKSINDIAHLMDKQTIAKYAESDTIIERLREMGVDFLQGYGIAKPDTLKELDRQL